MITIVNTIGGEMWDQISLRIYGAERFASSLMRENPAYADVVKFDAGIQVKVPAVNTSTNLSNVPWGQLFVTA